MVLCWWYGWGFTHLAFLCLNLSLPNCRYSFLMTLFLNPLRQVSALHCLWCSNIARWYVWVWSAWQQPGKNRHLIYSIRDCHFNPRNSSGRLAPGEGVELQRSGSYHTSRSSSRPEHWLALSTATGSDLTKRVTEFQFLVPECCSPYKTMKSFTFAELYLQRHPVRRVCSTPFTLRGRTLSQCKSPLICCSSQRILRPHSTITCANLISQYKGWCGDKTLQHPRCAMNSQKVDYCTCGMGHSA